MDLAAKLVHMLQHIVCSNVGKTNSFV